MFQILDCFCSICLFSKKKKRDFCAIVSKIQMFSLLVIVFNKWKLILHRGRKEKFQSTNTITSDIPRKKVHFDSTSYLEHIIDDVEFDD